MPAFFSEMALLLFSINRAHGLLGEKSCLPHFYFTFGGGVVVVKRMLSSKRDCAVEWWQWHEWWQWQQMEYVWWWKVCWWWPSHVWWHYHVMVVVVLVPNIRVLAPFIIHKLWLPPLFINGSGNEGYIVALSMGYIMVCNPSYSPSSRHCCYWDTCSQPPSSSSTANVNDDDDIIGLSHVSACELWFIIFIPVHAVNKRLLGGGWTCHKIGDSRRMLCDHPWLAIWVVWVTAGFRLPRQWQLEGQRPPPMPMGDDRAVLGDTVA